MISFFILAMGKVYGQRHDHPQVFYRHKELTVMVMNDLWFLIEYPFKSNIPITVIYTDVPPITSANRLMHGYCHTEKMDFSLLTSVLSRDPPSHHFGRVFGHLDGFGRGWQPFKYPLLDGNSRKLPKLSNFILFHRYNRVQFNINRVMWGGLADNRESGWRQ